jgi:hypothetical protein
MRPPAEIRSLSGNELEGTTVIPARPVNLRRDLYQFVTYVQTYGLTRTYRENSIPKAAARKLARVLSYKEEAQAVEKDGAGFWSDMVSRIARTLSLVSFNVKGSYIGYSSTTESYPENDIVVDAKHWKEYLGKSPSQKERAIVEALLQMMPNEFFSSGTLLTREHFDTWGSATGPASRMKLPSIRRSLLNCLARLSPNVWYDTRAFVDLLRSEKPDLILNPDTCEPDFDSARMLRQWEYDVQSAKRKKQKEPPRPQVRHEDIYSNFHEFERKGYREYSTRKERKLTARSPDGFHRVEGRYVEWFLSEIPYLAGFVDLAFRGAHDSHGNDVVPAFERLLAFRLNPWFFSVMGDDALLERVNVAALPNYEVIIDALSYPEIILAQLAPYTVLISEDGPVLRFRLDRKKVIDAAAACLQPAAEVLARLTGKPIPANVAAELQAWCNQGEKLVFFEEGVALLELHAGADLEIRESVSEYLADPGEDGFVFVRDAEKAFDRLEQKLYVPARVRHPKGGFNSCGVFAVGVPPAAQEPGPRKAPPLKVRLHSEDLVGYRSPHRPLLEALHEALRGQEVASMLPECGDLLIVPAAALPKLRAALRNLSDRFEVETETRPAKEKNE